MNTKICVAGLGKLGLPIAASFARAGIDVTGYDLDPNKVLFITDDSLLTVNEPGLLEAIKASKDHLTATVNAAEAIRGTQACIFITPTPSLPDGSFDNRFLVDAIKKIAQEVAWDEIAEHMPPKPYLFIIASTTTPGSCEKVFYPLIKSICQRPFELVYKPELIAIGTVLRDLANPDLLLFGGSPSATELASELYEKIVPRKVCDSRFRFMTLIEAELAKISLNCAITMKISFANQVLMVAERYGADASCILKAIGYDSRIGQKCLNPGMPYGGPCFPRDNRMFIRAAFAVGADAPLAQATDCVNEQIVDYIFQQIPSDGDVGILGASYKVGTTITEESAGMALRKKLLAAGRYVMQHDPHYNLFEAQLEEVLRCPTVIVTLDAPEYRRLVFPRSTLVIDPMKVTR